MKKLLICIAILLATSDAFAQQAHTPIEGTIRQKNIAKARAASAKTDFAPFTLQENQQGKLDLVVNGKVYFTAQEIDLINEEPSTYKSSTGNDGMVWYFIVFNSFGGVSGTYGVIAMDVYQDKNTGKKMAGCIQTIPYRPAPNRWYSYIEKHQMILKCTTNSGAPVFFTYNGQTVEWPDPKGKAVIGELPDALKNFKDYKQW